MGRRKDGPPSRARKLQKKFKFNLIFKDDFKRRKQLQNDGNSVMLKNVHVYDKTKVCLRVILTRIETFPPYGRAERRPPVENDKTASETQNLLDVLS